ncbi:hypothetical protein LXL04_003374 [Taraxacum kok-saghyz]
MKSVLEAVIPADHTATITKVENGTMSGTGRKLPRNYDVMHLALRLACVSASLAAVVVMTTAKEKSTISLYGFDLPVYSKWSFSDSFDRCSDQITVHQHQIICWRSGFRICDDECWIGCIWSDKSELNRDKTFVPTKFLFCDRVAVSIRFAFFSCFLCAMSVVLDVVWLSEMGRRKRICIITTDIPTEGGQSNEGQSTENEINGETSEHSATDIPSEGAQKKRVRGYNRKTETWNMSSSHKILVTFNEFDKPIGNEGNELTQYLGTLVRMPNHVEVDYDERRKAKFDIHPEETPEIKSWIFYNMGKKWRTWKASLKAHFYDESLSADEMMALQAAMDNRVNPVQFEKLVTQWCNPEYKSMCKVRIESRKKMEEPHVSGTKSFARIAHEVELETGVCPTRGQIYVKWHTRKNGKIVNGKVSEVVVMILYLGLL